MQLETGYSHLEVGALVFLLLCGPCPKRVCQAWATPLSLHPVSLEEGKGYRLVLQESEGTQGITHSLVFEN